MTDEEIKKQAIELYNSLKSKLIKQPSSTIFYKNFPGGKQKLAKIYGAGAFNKLVKELGDNPIKFGKEKFSEEDFFNSWGNLVRKISKIPTRSDWAYYKMQPSDTALKNRFNITFSLIFKLFKDFAKDKKEWNDVLEILPKENIIPILSNDNEPNDDVDIKNNLNEYIPPIIKNLPELSKIEGKSLEFEKKINIAFQILGFKIDFSLGQGTGRNPDGIAYDVQNHYAILYDAKSRKDGYSIGTDDRQFIEYINSFKKQIIKNGYEKLYFLIISSKFNHISKFSINKVLKETGVSLSFIRIDDLMKIISNKIENPLIFDFEEFRSLLIEGGEIDSRKVNKFLGK